MEVWEIKKLELIIAGIVILILSAILIFSIIAIYVNSKLKHVGKIFLVIIYVISIVLTSLTLFWLLYDKTAFQKGCPYNDLAVLGKNVTEIEEKYGEFDYGKNEEGRHVRTYEYRESTWMGGSPPLMEYNVVFDENGMAYQVYTDYGHDF